MERSECERKIRWIFFDLGGVLFFFDFWTICARFSRASGIGPSQIFRHGFQSGLVHGFDRGEMEAGEFHERICRLFGTPIPYEEFRLMWCDIFKPNPDMISLFQSLKEQKYPLHLVSNTNELHFGFLKRRYPFLSLFDGETLSYKVGRLKPDEEIFRIALARAGASPSESVFIDDIEVYASAARSLGMHGLRYIHCPGVAASLECLGVRVTP
ncbi:MAG: HAD family phosphatase [Deltaproteobacteria bacterium]|nr:HAD family phosphatase [Deltaproteobacteria bacterium]